MSVATGGVLRLVRDGFVPLPAAATAGTGAIRALAVDSDGQLWAACDRGLARWTGQRFERMPDPEGGTAEPVLQIASASDGGLWVRFERRLCRWQAGGWSAEAEPWQELGMLSHPSSGVIHARASALLDLLLF